MTTILAIQGDGFAVIGADSRWVDGYDRLGKQSQPKVVSVGRYLIGMAGDTRGINLIQHVFAPPVLPVKLSGIGLTRFMVSQFIPVYRTCLEMGGSSLSAYEDNPAYSSIEALVLANGTIYQIDNDYGTEEDVSGIYALGSGQAYGIAALEAVCSKKEMTPHTAKQALLKALNISAKYDGGTGAPFHTFVQARDGNKKPAKPV